MSTRGVTRIFDGTELNVLFHTFYCPFLFCSFPQEKKHKTKRGRVVMSIKLYIQFCIIRYY